MAEKDCIVVREFPGYDFRELKGTEGTVEECAAFIQRQRDTGKRWRDLTIKNTETGRLMSHIVR